MAASETRLLLLGAVALFQPVNGYQIRRELISWRVDRWAHVKPGSIYHGLASLTRQGFLVRHDLLDGGREVAVYELTDAGSAELERLLVESLETVDPYDRVAFHAAFSMLPLLEPDRVVRCLTRRRAALDAAVADLTGIGPEAGPPHAHRSVRLWLDVTAAELAWLLETIELVRSGELRFRLGDDWGWEPPPEDPGWQMSADRDRYRALLGR